MTEYTGLDAAQAVVRFAVQKGASLPEEQLDFLVEVISTPDLLRTIICGIEVLYASRENISLDLDSIELLKDLATLVERNNFYGYSVSGRSMGIISVAERILSGSSASLPGDLEADENYSATITTTEVGQ